MKLDNRGWGMQEFITILVGLFISLIIVVIFYNKLINYKELKSNTNVEFNGESTIKTYIELEDKITEQAKKYNTVETENKIIIKLDTLIKNGYINTVIDPKNKRKCSGYVVYNGETKEYKTYLSCPGNYQTSDYNSELE